MKSEPLLTFEKHLDTIIHLAKLMESGKTYAFNPVNDAMDKLKGLVSAGRQIPEANANDAFTGAMTALEEVRHYVELLTFLRDWMLVMIVAFAEAYLENILTLLVKRNPAWVDDLKLKVSYAELTASASLAGGMETISNRWQRSWVTNILRDKPPQWITRLEKLGAHGYRTGLPADMTSVWDKGHAIIHSGETQSLSASEFKKALNVIGSFVEPTDRFVVAFLAGHS